MILFDLQWNSNALTCKTYLRHAIPTFANPYFSIRVFSFTQQVSFTFVSGCFIVSWNTFWLYKRLASFWTLDNIRCLWINDIASLQRINSNAYIFPLTVKGHRKIQTEKNIGKNIKDNRLHSKNNYNFLKSLQNHNWLCLKIRDYS